MVAGILGMEGGYQEYLDCPDPMVWETILIFLICNLELVSGYQVFLISDLQLSSSPFFFFCFLRYFHHSSPQPRFSAGNLRTSSLSISLALPKITHHGVHPPKSSTSPFQHRGRRTRHGRRKARRHARREVRQRRWA